MPCSPPREPDATRADRPLWIIPMVSGSLKGGAEEALLQLAREHARLPARLLVVILEPGPLAAALRRAGVEAVNFPAGRLREPRRFFRTVEFLARLIRRRRAALVLGWMTKGHLYGGLAALRTGTPAFYFQMGLPDRGIVDRLARWIPARRAFACSDFARDLQAAAAPHDVQTVHLAADLARFQPASAEQIQALRRSHGLPLDQPIIGIVGRMQSWKGMHVFIDAMAEVLRQNPRATGILVGGTHAQEPDYEARLQRQIANLGLGGSIRMVGARSDVPDWMRMMDVVVHASDREPFGIVVVEAMALGKPVVATAPGGPAEILTDGLDGQLCAYGDSSGLARAIERFLDDGEFAARCGAAAALRARHFSPARFAARLADGLTNFSARPPAS